MKVFIRAEKGIPKTINNYTAMRGFEQLGAEVVLFETTEELLEQVTREDIVAGWISDAIYALRKFGVPEPYAVDYPKELYPYLGRKIWMDRISKILSSPEMYPVFVKSHKQKMFTGKVITKLGDLIGAGYQREDYDVWCSEPVEFISEWRCFIRYNKVVDMRPYVGVCGVAPDKNVVDEALERWTIDKPVACSMDFGVTSDGRTLLVECNDGFALGGYGIHELRYAKIISARWFEMVGGIDPYRDLIC